MSDTELKEAEAFLDKGDRQAARQHLAKLLATHPDDVHALHLLSTIDMDEGLHAGARAKIKRVLELDPAHASAKYNLGVCLMNEGNASLALGYFRQALLVNPKHSGALYNVGYLLRAEGHIAEASGYFEQLVKSNPDWMSAWEAYCETLLLANRFDDALTACNVLVRNSKANAKIYRLRADANRHLGNLADAETNYISSFKIDANDPDTLINFAGTLQLLDRVDQAIPLYERVILIAAKDSRYQDRFDPALSELIRACRRQCQWQRLKVYEEQAVMRMAEPNSAIQPLLAVTLTDDARDIQSSARSAWPKSFPAPRFHKRADSSSTAKLKIGFLSENYGQNPVTHQLTELIEGHSRDRLELIGYSMGNFVVSPMRKRIRNAFDSFRELGTVSGETAATLIADNQLDLLINVLGYNAQSHLRVLCYKPAPVIANYLAMPGTMGTRLIDYIIADGTVVRTDDDAFYDEAIVRVPQSHRSINPVRELNVALKSRSDYGLSETAFVFCAFEPTEDISPKNFAARMGILKDVPNSQLWLREERFSIRANLRKEAVALGVNAERLVFVSTAQYQEQVERLKLADLYLDSWPKNSDATVSESLQVGLPVLTQTGRSFASRTSAGLLNAAQLPELITGSELEFHKTAVRLANDPAALSALTQRLRTNRAQLALFDTKRLCAHMEQAYERMVERDRLGLAPESFSIAPSG
ncbi:MAG: tetratricopeptide repeat protein [Alphaproteobacteria bacterium]|nr:tetratricopeptide repeat protein [Alphaproteobacteria bacterium]